VRAASEVLYLMRWRFDIDKLLQRFHHLGHVGLGSSAQFA
jgi:hypothetical protein